MTAVQAVLLGIMGWVVVSPFFGGQFNQISKKPLTVALFCGIIMGDMATAMAIGVPLQAMYLGVMVVGGVSSMPPINISAWFIIPLSMLAGGDAEYAILMAATFGSVENVVGNVQKLVNLISVHMADNFVHKGQLSKAFWSHYTGYLWTFLLYFPTIVAANLVGSAVIVDLVTKIPQDVVNVLNVFVSLCPLIGFSLLLINLVKNNVHLIFVLLGFMTFKVMGLSIISIAIVGVVLAYLVFVATGSSKEAQ